MNGPTLPRRLPTSRRMPLLVGASSDSRTVLVTGATGFIGQHLARHMVAAGHRVIALVRDAKRGRDLCGPHVETLTSLNDIASEHRIDVIINLAGEPILAGRWTPRRRGL